MKRVALADSVRRAHALDKANGTHLSKYAELNRKYEALEKVYPPRFELSAMQVYCVLIASVIPSPNILRP